MMTGAVELDPVRMWEPVVPVAGAAPSARWASRSEPPWYGAAVVSAAWSPAWNASRSRGASSPTAQPPAGASATTVDARPRAASSSAR